MADRNALKKKKPKKKSTAAAKKRTKRTSAAGTTSLARILRMLRDRGTMTLVPELVQIVAGGPVAGSWWGHPKGKDIFRLANELEDVVLTAKLIEGKTTFVDARLWPALYRVVMDVKWRRVRSAKLDRAARDLLRSVELAGRMRVDDPKLKAARKTLEASLLVRSVQEHTESGHHATAFESWDVWAQNENVARSERGARGALATTIIEGAAELSLDDAHATLREARISL